MLKKYNMIWKLQTRIKVVTIGEDIKYIPQKKGLKKIDNSYQNFVFFICFIFFPISIVLILCEILIWDELDDYSMYITQDEEVSSYSKEYAQKMIDYVLDEQQRLSKPKPKKKISYIKYP
jgi:hypothetical protein